MNSANELEIKKGVILNKRYQVMEKIGEGAYGDVYKVFDSKNKKKRALKMFKTFIFSKSELENTIKEIDYLIKYKNKNIIKYQDHFIEDNRGYFVTNYYKNGDLDQFIKERKVINKKLNKINIFNWSKHMLTGIEFLHSNNIIHRDLKPSNIFLNDDLLIIGDLGLAKSLNELQSSKIFAGTINYVSPEILNQVRYKFEVDIWSFGCIYYELVELKKAFDGASFLDISKAIVEDPIPEIIDKDLNVILKKCFNRNQNKRATAKELIEIIINNNFKNNDITNENNDEKISDAILPVKKGQNLIAENIKSLNNKCRFIKEGNQEDIDIMKESYDEIKSLKEIININEIEEKNDYIELLEKLGSYEVIVLTRYKQELELQTKILDLKNMCTPKNDLWIADTLSNLGLGYLNTRRLDKSINCYEEALEIKKKYLPSDNLSIADTLSNLGNVCYYLNDLKRAKDCVDEAIEIYKLKSAEVSLDYAKALDYCGNINYALNNEEKSKEYFKEALEIKVKILPERHSSIVDTLNGLGVVLDKLTYFEKALEIAKTLPEYHLSRAKVLFNIGNLYHRTGSKLKSIQSYKGAIKIFRKILQENHSIIADALNSLGLIYKESKDFTEAEGFFLEALEIKRKTDDSSNKKSIAKTLNNLAEVYDYLGDKNKEKECYEKTLEIYLKLLPKDDLETADLFSKLSLIYSKSGEKNKAKEYLDKSWNVYKEKLAEDNLKLANVLFICGEVYNNLNSVYKANQIFQKAKEYFELEIKNNKTLINDNKSMADVLYRLALINYHLGFKNDAKELFEKTLEIKKKILKENDSSIADLLLNLGRLCDRSIAIGYFEKAYEIYKETYKARNHIKLAYALFDLAGFYLELEELSRAHRYYEEALVIAKNAPNAGNDMFLASIYSEIGKLLYNGDLFNQAKEYYEIELKIKLKLLPEDDLEIANLYPKLSLVYIKLGEGERAIDYLANSFNIYTKKLYDNNMKIFSLLNNKSVYKDLKDPNKAKLYVGNALEIKDILLPENEVMYNRLIGLSKVYEVLGHYSIAKNVNNKANEVLLKLNENKVEIEKMMKLILKV